jgi:autotransporter-associated beta strand protein
MTKPASHIRSSKRAALAATLLAALASINAHAATFTFNGTTDNNWATGSNWAGGVAAPVNGTFANRININGNLLYTASTSTTGATHLNPSDRGFLLGTVNSVNATFTIQGGNFSTDGATNSQDVLGVGTGTVVTLTVDGGNYSTVEGLIVNFGNTGTQATFNVNSGSATVSKLDINPNTGSGATGAVNVSGGSLTVTTLNSTPSGTGDSSVNVTGGTMAVTTLNTGLTTKSGGLSTINIGGGASTVGTLNLGAYSTGSINGTTTLNVTNGSLGVGTLAVAANGTGTASNNTSTINLDGGTLGVGAVTATSGAKGSTTFNFNGGTLRIDSGSLNLSGFNNAFVKAGGAVINTNGNNATITQALLTDVVSTGGGLSKSGTGTLTLSGDNTYTGATTVNNGTLALGAANRIANVSSLVMAGGTFATNGFNETLGTLVLSASSTIDLGDGASALLFADSSGAVWSGSVSLSFVNFTEGVDSIRIGTNGDGLTETQLSQITINGLAAAINSSGYLTAIPEPSTYAVIAGAASLFLVAGYRRRSARTQS